MKPKHTPGPWRVDPALPGLVRINDDPTAGILVGQMANARLVAAAPELLAALKAVIKVADRKTKEFDAARAAIAKAEL